MRGFFVFLFLMIAGPVAAQDPLVALGRLTGEGLSLSDRTDGVVVGVDMNRALPWRVFTLDNPTRLVVDFSELDWADTDGRLVALQSDRIVSVQTGLFRPGWTRMVAVLDRPMVVRDAAMTTVATGAEVSIRLTDADDEAFAATVGAPDSALFADYPHAGPVIRRGEGDLVVVLDPGHGGIDPGAEHGGVIEKDLMLTFARELKDVLSREDNVEVVLTRDEDVFVPLEERVSIARAAGADVFLSLHADALAEGRAHGATVYTLAEEASDVASQMLAERHDRADLLAGIDLSETDDEVALLLMDLARTETTPRADALADALVHGIFEATQSTYKTPRLKASFSVLKAPDIPSALIELGFLSSKRDLEQLTDPEWRRQAAGGIRNAIVEWAEADQAAVTRLRQ